MKRWLVSVLTIVVLTLLFMKIFGSIWFTDDMTEALVRTAAWLNIYGDEGIEDFYLLTTALVSLALSLLIVSIVNIVRTRRVRP